MKMNSAKSLNVIATRNHSRKDLVLPFIYASSPASMKVSE